ncbi:3-dehydroquinate synthase [Streptomyces sp. NPDC002994]|uniref:3-dehydroquinate synthase n=1 Tax=Streptomyces sp. NPDC002994 TaxID=3154441 RepID=UPI0033A2ADD6
MPQMPAVNPVRVPVITPGGSYDIVIGRGLLDDVVRYAGLAPHTRRVVVIASGVPAKLYAPRVVDALSAAGLHVRLVEVPDGEQAKNLTTVAGLYEEFADFELGRDDAVFAVGGGVTGDMAGFAAASWHRGVAVVQVPTTLLAQVDSAVGGKTGVNLPSGKNLVGAFHQPRSVVVDLDTLSTLEERDRRAGLGEVAKYGFIADPVVLSLLEESPDDAVAAAPGVIDELVVRSLRCKAGVVSADEKEAGERALLNYGHTVGHAVEAAGGYARYRHGEAVALGMVFAARLSVAVGEAEPSLVDRTVALLAGLGLPTGGLEATTAELWSYLRRDKKARDGVRFVVCSKPGAARLVDQPSADLIDELLDSLR